MLGQDSVPFKIGYVISPQQRGDPVNLETDVIGKYVEKLLSPTMGRRQDSTITKEFLSQHGF